MKPMQRSGRTRQTGEQHGLWLFLSLCALLVSMAPLPAWACPMTGRMGDSKLVCRAAGQGQMLKCCGNCARFGGKCCKPISLPPLLNNEDDPRDQNLKAAAFEALNPPVLVEVSVFADLDVVPLDSQTCPLIPIPAASPPPLLSQHNGVPFTSRAPPQNPLS